jgi:hypothetical protein
MSIRGGSVTPPTKTVEVDIRADDDDVHPQAVIREEEALAYARTSRLKFFGGATGVILASAAFVVALVRYDVWLLGASFVGVMVAGLIIPPEFVKDVIPVRFRGGE